MVSKKFTLILFLFAFLCISCDVLQKKPRSVPNLKGISVKGEDFSFEFNQCRSTIIAFGASFCPPCKVDHEIFTQIYDSLKSDSLCVLYVNADEDLKTMQNYVKNMEIPYPSLHWNYELMNNLGNPNLLPTYFIADQNGNIKIYAKGMLGKSGITKLRQYLQGTK